MKFIEEAQNNLLKLKENPYPGRGIIVGLNDEKTHIVHVYWIMGRSFNSQNRIFVLDEDENLKTEAFDAEKVEDPSLIIYKAMGQNDQFYSVSNGHQTDNALATYVVGMNAALGDWKYEPDKPNYTPRITAVTSINNKSAYSVDMAVFSKSPFNEGCDKKFYKLNLEAPGIGYCITTYSGDGNPLPSFVGDPYILPLSGNICKVSRSIWNHLNEANRVSLAVRFIDIKDGKSSFDIINKHLK